MDARAIENLPMPATYARHLARVFDPDALFEGTGIDAALLDDGERRISVRQVLRYIENALALAEEPDWYLRWMRTIADRFHGPITLALQSAPTLGHGVDVFLEFFPSRTPYMHMQGRNEGDSFLAELWPLIDLGASKPLLVEAPLMILQQYLDTVYGVDFGEASLMLDYPPTPYADRYSRYFKPEVRFDAPSSALVIPKAWRSLQTSATSSPVGPTLCSSAKPPRRRRANGRYSARFGAASVAVSSAPHAVGRCRRSRTSRPSSTSRRGR